MKSEPSGVLGAGGAEADAVGGACAAAEPDVAAEAAAVGAAAALAAAAPALGETAAALAVVVALGADPRFDGGVTGCSPAQLAIATPRTRAQPWHCAQPIGLGPILVPWRDGTTALVFEPLDLVARVCAMIPPPGFHLVRYHGLFARAAKLRAEVVPAPPSAAAPGIPSAPQLELDLRGPTAHATPPHGSLATGSGHPRDRHLAPLTAHGEGSSSSASLDRAPVRARGPASVAPGSDAHQSVRGPLPCTPDPSVHADSLHPAPSGPPQAAPSLPAHRSARAHQALLQSPRPSAAARSPCDSS